MKPIASVFVCLWVHLTLFAHNPAAKEKYSCIMRSRAFSRFAYKLLLYKPLSPPEAINLGILRGLPRARPQERVCVCVCEGEFSFPSPLLNTAVCWQRQVWEKTILFVCSCLPYVPPGKIAMGIALVYAQQSLAPSPVS